MSADLLCDLAARGDLARPVRLWLYALERADTDGVARFDHAEVTGLLGLGDHAGHGTLRRAIAAGLVSRASTVRTIHVTEGVEVLP
ncbi:hypothetical protein ACHAAC_16765 [Aeromicrobium sp. CF4.19]|uniref:hypothetical protein n=1 Tax=Aeromicrobium sp. CF4.19 TaxID=3373082 RepID=UPI003EE7FB8F